MSGWTDLLPRWFLILVPWMVWIGIASGSVIFGLSTYSDNLERWPVILSDTFWIDTCTGWLFPVVTLAAVHDGKLGYVSQVGKQRRADLRAKRRAYRNRKEHPSSRAERIARLEREVLE